MSSTSRISKEWASTSSSTSKGATNTLSTYDSITLSSPTARSTLISQEKRPARSLRRRRSARETTIAYTSARNRSISERTLVNTRDTYAQSLRSSETQGAPTRSTLSLLINSRKSPSASGILKCASGGVSFTSTTTTTKTARRNMTARKPLKTGGPSHPLVVADQGPSAKKPDHLL